MLLALVLGEVMAVLGGNILLLLMGIPAIVIIKIITKKQVGLFVVIFLLYVAGFLLSKEAIIESEKIYDLAETQVAVTGRVDKINESSYGWSLYLNDVIINKLNCKRILITLENEPKVAIGNMVSVQGQLVQFDVARNKGNFNSKEYYKSLGIYAKIEGQQIEVIESEIDFLRNALHTLKTKFRLQLDKICKEENAAIYKAILLGDKNEIDGEIKELYSLAGISHVLAISGLHISFIGMFIYSLMRKRFGFSLSASVSIMIVVSFGILSGMGIATVRAIVMFGLKLLGDILGRYYDYLTVVSVAAILLVLDNPFVVINSGFQMSFMAIIAITIVWPILKNILRIKDTKKVSQVEGVRKIKGIIYQNSNNIASRLINSIAQGLNISAMMNPIIAFNYYQLPTYSFLLNLIVVPLMNVIIISGIMGILLSFISEGLGKACIFPGQVVLKFYTELCNFSSRLPFSSVIVGKPTIWVIVTYYLLLVLLLIIGNRIRKKLDKNEIEAEKNISKEGREPKTKNVIKKKKRITNIKSRIAVISFFLLLSLLIYNPAKELLRGDRLEVTFIDVGQGDGIFIRANNGTTITVDGGSTSVISVGKYRIIPYLKAEGVGQIDYAIVTHTDTDHISGLIEMIEASSNGIKIKNLILPKISTGDETYAELVRLADEYGVKVLYISQGDTMKFGLLEMECLYPISNIVTVDKNDSSTVLSVKYGGFSMLLTGDISTTPEGEMLSLLENQYTILKVAHHGSKYSTSEEFLNVVNPVYSIISVGENNMYGHPSEEVLERLRLAGSYVLRTDEYGGISIVVDEKIQMRQWIKPTK